MKRILIPLLALLGVAAIVAGVLAGTVYKPPAKITATTASEPSAPLLVIDAGVAPLVDEDVDMQVTADGPVSVVRATPSDIDAWVGELAVQHVTGLQDWQHLQVSETAGDGSGKNPAAAEMFAEIRTGDDKLTWQVSDPEHRWAFLLATDGTKPAPKVTLTWDNPHAHDWMWPLLITGAVLLGLALIWWASSRFGKRQAPSEETEVIYVPALTPEEAEGLTRKQIRDLERERERAAYQQARRDGKRNVSILTSQTIPVIDAPLLEQHPERLIDTGMAGGAMVVPFAPHAGGDRLAAADGERFAPKQTDPASRVVERTSITEPAASAPDAGRCNTDELWADTPRDDDEVDI